MNLNSSNTIISALDYATQLGPDHSGHDMCGPACCASMLLSAGWQSDPYQLMIELANALPGGWHDQGMDSETIIGMLLNNGFEAKTWVRWQEAEDALDAGQGVLCLNNNKLFVPQMYPQHPGSPDDGGWWAEHWVRLYGLVNGGNSALVYDPLCYAPQTDGSFYQGPVVYTTDSLRAAIRATPYTEAGVIVRRD